MDNMSFEEFRDDRKPSILRVDDRTEVIDFIIRWIPSSAGLVKSCDVKGTWRAVAILVLFRRGEVAEWSIAAVSKTVEPLRVPEVRILSSPPFDFQNFSPPTVPIRVERLQPLIYRPSDSSISQR